jgi:membrane protein implicated in regulation of membrane protease activity
MTWWSWMIFGLLLLGTEMLAIDAQFYLVFLGISAALVGLAGLLGIVIPEWAQWAAFAVMALVFFFTFRRSLYEKLRKGAKGFDESFEGQNVDVTSEMAAGGEARLQFRGSEWTVRNVGENAIAGGSRAEIVNVDGLTLHISAD